MKQSINLSALFLFLLILSGCNKDEKGTLVVSFRAVYDGEVLTINDYHDYAFSQRIQFVNSDFFVSNLRLLTESGTYPLSDLELVRVSYENSADADRGTEFTFIDVPARSYQGIEFGVGVEPELNSTVPADWPSSHPLSETSRYWNAWNSYVHTKTEGNLDTMDNGSDSPDLGYAYHTGTDTMYQVLRALTSIPVREDQKTSIVMNLDHRTLMGVPADPIDIKANPQNHTPADTAELWKIVLNFSSSLSYTIE